MDDKQRPEKPVKPAVVVRFQGISNCEWRAQASEYGLIDVVNNNGDVIASVMPVPGDTPDKKFHRIHALIIAASAKILQSTTYCPDGTVQELIERIDKILNESND
jgi:hypothetical protein